MTNMTTKKKVLITGAQGYIGSVLVPYLRDHGFDCVGYDTGFFADCLLYAADDSPVIRKDMRDFSPADLNGIEAVVHLAAISNDPLKNFDPGSVYGPVRQYSRTLAERCKAAGVRLIFASSCSVYGQGQSEMLDESSPTDPRIPYSLNKLQIEADLKEISDQTWAPIILRFATLFGPSPRMRFDIVVNMLTAMAFTTKKIIMNSDGLAWRPVVHIQDVCQAIRHAIDFEGALARPLVLNVGKTSENYTVRQLAELIQSAVPGSAIEYLAEQKTPLAGAELIADRKIQNPTHTHTYRVSFERIKEVFSGFECEWPVRRGVTQLLEVFTRLPLTAQQFHDINFYRLQKIESLQSGGRLTGELRWAGGKV